MKFVVFHDESNNYVLEQLNASATHFVIGNMVVSPANIVPNVFRQLNNIDYDAIILAINSNKNLERVLFTLHAVDVKKIIYIVKFYALANKLPFMQRERFLYDKVDTVNGGGGKPYFVHIETHVCDHCNLNCKACNNFSPFVRNRSCASVEQWENDIKRLTNVYQVGRIFLLGGEPLLESKLAEEFINVTRKYAPASEIYLCTNGLLIPAMKDEFWETILKNQVILSITAYAPTIQMMPKIWDTLDSRGIRYKYHKALTFAKRVTTQPNSDAKFNSVMCGSAGCHYMRDGFIAKCPDAMLIKHMDNYLGTNLQSHCNISLDEIENAPYTVLEKLIAPIDLCHYCANQCQNIVWEPVQGSPQANDWII